MKACENWENWFCFWDLKIVFNLYKVCLCLDYFIQGFPYFMESITSNMSCKYLLYPYTLFIIPFTYELFTGLIMFTYYYYFKGKLAPHGKWKSLGWCFACLWKLDISLVHMYSNIWGFTSEVWMWEKYTLIMYGLSGMCCLLGVFKVEDFNPFNPPKKTSDSDFQSSDVHAHVHCLRSEKCTCACNLNNKSLLDGNTYECQGPGSDN